LSHYELWLAKQNDFSIQKEEFIVEKTFLYSGFYTNIF